MEGLRGLAALIVVVAHADGFLPPSRILDWLQHAMRLGASSSVMVFFVLSGYCIHLRRTVAHGGGQVRHLQIRRFYGRRIKRLYPTFLVVVLAGGALDMLSSAIGHPGFRMDFAPTTLFWTLALQGMLVAPIFGSNGSLWSLGYEAYYYLAYPVVRWAVVRWSIIRVFAAVAAVSLAAYGGTHYGLTFFLTPVLILWVAWCAGVLLAELSHRRSAWTARLLAALWVGLVALNVVSFRWTVFQFASAVGGMLLVLGATSTRTQVAPLRSALRALAPIGLMSYSLYLVHGPILIFMVSVVPHRLPGLLTFVVGVLASVLIGFAFFTLVERRSLARPSPVAGGPAGSGTTAIRKPEESISATMP